MFSGADVDDDRSATPENDVIRAENSTVDSNSPHVDLDLDLDRAITPPADYDEHLILPPPDKFSAEIETETTNDDVINMASDVIKTVDDVRVVEVDCCLLKDEVRMPEATPTCEEDVRPKELTVQVRKMEIQTETVDVVFVPVVENTKVNQDHHTDVLKLDESDVPSVRDAIVEGNMADGGDEVEQVPSDDNSVEDVLSRFDHVTTEADHMINEVEVQSDLNVAASPKIYKSEKVMILNKE